MTAYLLDTNIVSMLDPTRHKQAPALIDWLDRNGARLFFSVMTITEMDSGILKLRRTNKNARADQIAALLTSILADFGDRVLAFDIETARHLARLGEETHQRTVPLPDLIIAATAARHGLVVLTHNMKDFKRLSVASIDPFAHLPGDD